MRSRRRWFRFPVMVMVLAGVVCLAGAGCGIGRGGATGGVDPSARVVDLPGAADKIDFDDTTYSNRLRRVLVPARSSGLYLVDPGSTTAAATRLELKPPAGSVDSVDEGRGLLFVLDRDNQQIAVVNPSDGRVLASAKTTGPADYVRYVPSVGELWITEPGASPPGIEIFSLATDPATPPRRTGFVEIPDGPEGITLSTLKNVNTGGGIGSTAGGPVATVFAHAGNDLAAIAVASRTVTRWDSGCAGTHGFPRVDDREGLALASCADNGEVSVLDVNNGGRKLGRHAVSGGESLPAYSTGTGHFYARGDPGTKLATLQATRQGTQQGIKQIHQVEVPASGHCLGANDAGRYWTCDADNGRILIFQDPPATPR